MIFGFGAAAVRLAAAASTVKNKPISALLGASALGCGAFTVWCIYANGQFSYGGKRNPSRQSVEGVAELPFDENSFDLVTALETIYFWPGLVEYF